MTRRSSAVKESRMKFTYRYGMFVIAMVIFAIAVTVFSTGVGAQDEGWQIVRADYGFRTQRNDVTDILKDLIGRGGVNGRVAVNNQTMGGDPAVGKDKTLRIFARNKRGEEREFNFNEGGFVEVRLFNIRRDDWDGLRIIRAYYGWQGNTVNVTDLLRSRMYERRLSLVVTNSAMGGDPAIGADKILVVIYRYQGKETATIVREGNTLAIP